ncbi:Cuticle protein 16.8 [Halotydeus destructor]|nr:Cuticle protein 16.8 [Halotydeus destructor]
MKLKVLLVLFCVTLSSVRADNRQLGSLGNHRLDDNDSAKSNQSEKKQSTPYAFGYDIQDKDGNQQHRHEHSDANGVRTGSYGYVDANGVYRKVVYIADKDGFRVKEMTSNEPGLNMKATPASVKAQTATLEEWKPLKIKRDEDEENKKTQLEKKLGTLSQKRTGNGNVNEADKSAPSSGSHYTVPYDSLTFSKRNLSIDSHAPREYDAYLASTPHYYYGSRSNQAKPGDSYSASSQNSNKYADQYPSMPTYQDVKGGPNFGQQLNSPMITPYQFPYPVETPKFSFPAPRNQDIFNTNEINHQPPREPYQSFPSIGDTSAQSTPSSDNNYLSSGYLHPLPMPVKPSNHNHGPKFPFGLTAPPSFATFPSSTTTANTPYLTPDIFKNANYYPPKPDYTNYNPYGPPTTKEIPAANKHDNPFMGKPTYPLPYEYTSPAPVPFIGRPKKSMTPSVVYTPHNELDKYPSNTSPFGDAALQSQFMGFNDVIPGNNQISRPKYQADYGPNNRPKFAWLRSTTSTEVPAVLLGIRAANRELEKERMKKREPVLRVSGKT